MLKALPAVAFCAMAAGAAGPPVAPRCDLVAGWTQAGPARLYTADNLYEYMDGNSEGYFLYHFQEMRGVTCKQGEVTFVIDISDMESADFAFGMFSSTRDLRQPAYPVGMGGQIVPRRLIFAKGKYYIEIAANPDGNYTDALKSWAAALDRAVEGETQPPAALEWFRAEGLESLRMVPESVLGLRVLPQGYVAQYNYGKAFVAFEDTAQAAAEAMGKLRARFGGATSVALGDEAFEAADQYLGRVCFFRKGRDIGGYAITAAERDAVAMARELAAKVQ